MQMDPAHGSNLLLPTICPASAASNEIIGEKNPFAKANLSFPHIGHLTDGIISCNRLRIFSITSGDKSLTSSAICDSVAGKPVEHRPGIEQPTNDRLSPGSLFPTFQLRLD